MERFNLQRSSGGWLLYGSLRYLDALELKGVRWLYYELARADGSHELRVSRLPS